MNFKMVTPERVVWEGDAAQVTLPVRDGEITVLSHHEPYIGALSPGEIIAKYADGEVSFAVSSGFVEFRGNTLSVLADTAERAEEIDVARAEEARRRAEELKSQKHEDEEEYARIAAALEKELARIRVARRHRANR